MAKFFRDSAFSQQSFGAAGFKVVSGSDSSATDGDFVAITVLEEATVGTAGIVTTTGDDLANTTVLPAGLTIYGDFTSIKLSAGKVIAYHRALG